MLLIIGAFAVLLFPVLSFRLYRVRSQRLAAAKPRQKFCAHLGRAGDPLSHAAVPSNDHRCYLYMQRDRIDLLHQQSFCLTTAHPQCPWLMIRRQDTLSRPEQLRRALAGLGQRLKPGFSEPRRIPALAFSAMRHIPALARKIPSALYLALRWLARLIWAVGCDVWALAQRSGLAAVSLVRVIRASFAALVRVLLGLMRGLSFVGRTAWGAFASLARRLKSRPQATVGTPLATETPLSAAALPSIESAVQAPTLSSEVVEPAPVVDRELVEPGPAVNQELVEGLFPALAAAEEFDFGEPPAAVQEPMRHLEALLSQGVAALDHDQEMRAYQLFLEATQQPAKLAGQAAPEVQAQRTSLLERAWFWRAKTAETVEEVVESLTQALRYEPDNPQLQTHLAWARERLERERYVREGSAAPQPGVQATSLIAEDDGAWTRRLGVGIRWLGGFIALALAALWMATGMLPAFGDYLNQLPAGDDLLLRRLVLTLNATALPGQGHLPLPVLDYNLGLSLPFILAFLFLFTARGLLDGDSWARTGGLCIAAIGAWLCTAAVSNPDAGRLGLALCVGLIVAAAAGRFGSSVNLRRMAAPMY